MIFEKIHLAISILLTKIIRRMKKSKIQTKFKNFNKFLIVIIKKVLVIVTRSIEGCDRFSPCR